MKYIHINCDLGEGGGQDEQLMPLISACNIACGGHTGDLETMRRTVKLALQNKVEMGAHPSYPDKNNFGRKSITMSSDDLKNSLVAQIKSLEKIAESEGGKLHHVKPHGALYNDAAKDENIARIVLDAVRECSGNLSLYAPENSVISQMAKGEIQVIFEAFADRNYEDDYRLVSRQKLNALLTQKKEVFEHLFLMISGGKIRTVTGNFLSCKASTFCLHSDTENAVEILEYLHQKFEEHHLKIS